MKRRTKIGISLGIILIVIGTVGSILTYKGLDKKAQPELNKTVHLSKEMKKKEFKLVINGSKTSYSITPSADNNIHIHRNKMMMNQGKLNYQLKQTQNQVILTIDAKNHEKYKNLPYFSVSDFNDFTNIQIKIPQNLLNVKIVANSQNIDVYQLNLPKLNITSKFSNISINNGNIDNLTLKSTSGTINSNELRGNSLKVENQNNDININNVRFDKIKASNQHGALMYSENQGKATLKNQNGTTNIQEIMGSVTVENVNGDIEASTSELNHNFTAENKNGDINVNIDTLPSTYLLEGNTQNGDLTLLNTHKKRIDKGNSNKKTHIQLDSENGDILVESASHAEDDDSDN